MSELETSEPATEQELTELLAADKWPISTSVLAWQDQALCTQTDPEAFFPEKGGSTREAKRVCLSCPVRAECLEYALATDERFGIWGGLSERERRRVKKNGLDPQTLTPRPTPTVVPMVQQQAAAESPASAGSTHERGPARQLVGAGSGARS